MIREGEKTRSILTGRVYKVKTIEDRSVVLESLDGSSQVWTEKSNLKLFYEEAENEEDSEDLISYQAAKQLRSPAFVKLDSL